MALIDWHDFVVAETIEFTEEEESGLPEPMAPHDLVAAAKREFFEQDVRPLFITPRYLT